MDSAVGRSAQQHNARGESLIEKMSQERIKQLEKDVEYEKTMRQNDSVDHVREIEGLVRQIAVIEEQFAEACAERDRSKASIDHLEQLRQQLQASDEELRRRLDRMQDKLEWDNILNPTSPWHACVQHLTGVPNAEVLRCLFELLNWNGTADRLRYWNGKATIARMQKEIDGETLRESAGSSNDANECPDAMVPMSSSRPSSLCQLSSK